MTIGSGIVGPGRQADIVVAPAINDSNDSSLVAVAGRDLGKAQAFAQRHGATLATDTFESLLESAAVDAVYIGTPNATHAELAAAALRAGKHVLIDKPLAVSPNECTALIELARRQDRKLGVCFQLRHDPAHREVRRLIGSGVIGKVVLVQASAGSLGEPAGWRSSKGLAVAGAIYDLGVHIFDLIRFVLDDDVVAVSAVDRAAPRMRWLDRTTVSVLSFRNDALGIATCDHRAATLRRDLEVFGTAGTITCSGSTDLSGRTQGDVRTEIRLTTEAGSTAIAVESRRLLFRQITDFNSAIRNDLEPDASGFDGLQSARIVEAVLRSLRAKDLIAV